MPIKIQDSLPAKKILESENIFVIPHKRAISQDIRPVKIIILNLMPIKSETETQLLRLLGNSPLQVDIELLQTATHISKNTPSKHLEMFYKTFDQVKNRKFDGMIITGAPVEKLAFEDVDYWDELCSIMQWSKTHIYSTLHICWGAQASLYYHYSIPKSILKAKLSGVFEHNILAPLHPLMRGFDDKFMMPHSRNTTISKEDILKINDLIILSESKESGIAIIGNKNGRQFFITGHPEYHKSTLSEEYFRDLNKGLHPSIPQNYFPNDNTALDPLVDWRSHANLLYINWLNYYVYQQTPYDLESIH